MSTRDTGSASRWRFSWEPWEGRIFKTTPLRARMTRYFSAFRSKELPGGPLVRVRMRGGAEWMNQKTARQVTTLVKQTTTSDRLQLSPKFSDNRLVTCETPN